MNRVILFYFFFFTRWKALDALLWLCRIARGSSLLAQFAVVTIVRNVIVHSKRAARAASFFFLTSCNGEREREIRESSKAEIHAGRNTARRKRKRKRIDETAQHFNAEESARDGSQESVFLSGKREVDKKSHQTVKQGGREGRRRDLEEFLRAHVSPLLLFVPFKSRPVTPWPGNCVRTALCPRSTDVVAQLLG